MSHEFNSNDSTEQFIKRRTVEFDPETVPVLTPEDMEYYSAELNDLYAQGLESDVIASRFTTLLHKNGLITGDGDLEEKVVRMVREDGTSSLETIVTSYHDFGTTLRGIDLQPIEAASKEKQDTGAEQLQEDIETFLNDHRFAASNEAALQLVRTNARILELLADGDTVLAAAARDGGRTETSTDRLSTMLTELRREHASAAERADDLRRNATSLSNEAEDMVERNRQNITEDEDLRRLRKIEESTNELRVDANATDGAYEEIADILMRHGQFESNLDELARTTQGYEFTISLLRKRIEEMTEGVYAAQARALRVEDTIADIQKAR